MGWTKVVYILVAFPVLAASPGTVTETVIVATETATVVATETVTVPGETVIEIETATATATVVVTETATPINDTPPLPKPTVLDSPNSKANLCDAKHGGGWATGYLISVWLNLFYCDRFNPNTQLYKSMACSAFSQIGIGFSLGAINNIMNSCDEDKSMDLSAIQGTSFVGLGTATFFKLHGCAYMFSRTIDSFSKCNEVSDHSINAFTSVCASVITG